jgi:molybdenum cofactor cytidylyltransferase
MSSAALLLAAGESSRFGGSPKALAPVGERTAIRRLVEISRETGLDPVIVVVGAHREGIAHEVRGLPVTVVEATDWYEGRTASVQAGLNAIPVDRDVLFWPVDHPFVLPSTIELLATLPRQDPFGVWFIPTYEGKSGHPVLWRSTVRRDLLELRPDAPIRALLPELGPQVRRVPVDDPGVVANVDTPEAYRQALDAWEQSEEE